VERVAAVLAESQAQKVPILPHWPELIFGLVIFAVFYFIVAKWVVPRLETIFAERTAAIEGGIEKAEKAQKEAAAAMAALEKQLADARTESAKIREEARAEGAVIIAEMRAQAQTEANRILVAAQSQIEAERQSAVVQLRAEVGDLATRLASRIVGESLEDVARQRRVVERFLAEIESAPVAGGGQL